jgi:hypothetical protein
MRGQIDLHDLAYIESLGIKPTRAEPCPKGGKGIINPHVTRFHHKDGVTDVFHIKPIYYEAKDGSWRPMSEVAAHHGNRNIVLKGSWGEKMSLQYFQWLMKRQRLFTGKELLIEGYSLQPRHMLFATDSTFYPDAHTETTTVDGYANYNDATYATARNAATGEAASDTINYETGTQHSLFSGTYYIGRCFFLFDTSAIGDTDTISAATFSYYLVDGVNNVDATHTAAVVSSSPASNTAIGTADYDQVGSTSFGSSAYSGSTSAYKDFSLNASGIANISKTGVSKFGTRGTEDINNTAPSGNDIADDVTAPATGAISL